LSCWISFFIIFSKGFGDYVPGQKTNDQLAALKLILAALYILFGISILGMCFDLMQEEIITKITWVGKKLGLLEDIDEEDNFDKNYDHLKHKHEDALRHGTKFGHSTNNESKSINGHYGH
jgi:hypothetical protein